MGRRLWATVMLIAVGALGCVSPVAAALDEEDANRVVVALDRAAIDATKEVDPASEGKFRVLVSRDDASHALAALREEELPRPRHRGVLDAMDKGSLVPSQAAEHAQLTAGLAGDLARTLESVDGVLSARVHLNLPVPDPLRDTAPAKSTASVLLSYRGSMPPIQDAAVQRVVAGGVPSLLPADVSVVMVSRPAPAAGDRSPLSHMGPLAVARGSLRPLQIGFAVLTGLLGIFAAATLVFYTRMARLREAAQKTTT